MRGRLLPDGALSLERRCLPVQRRAGPARAGGLVLGSTSGMSTDQQPPSSATNATVWPAAAPLTSGRAERIWMVAVRLLFSCGEPSVGGTFYSEGRHRVSRPGMLRRRGCVRILALGGRGRDAYRCVIVPGLR